MKRVLLFLFIFTQISFLFWSPDSLIASNKTGAFNKKQPSFIENKGQIIDQNNKLNPGVLYLLTTPGFNVQLRKGGFSYDVYTAAGHKPQASSYSLKPVACSLKPVACSLQYHRIDFDLQDFNPVYTIETSDPSPDYLNYYTTGTPDEGVTFVHSFQTITYKDIYPYVDLEFIAEPKSGFKYNFIVHRGGDLNTIRINISGPDIEVTSTGSLLLKNSIATIEEKIPSCFLRGENSTIPVNVRFTKIKDGEYGFKLDSLFIAHCSLFIDPIPTRKWGTYYGGDAYESMDVNECAVDNLGNCIIGGVTASLTNIASTGAHQQVMGGFEDGFFAKFDPDGQRIWGTYYGGASGDNVQCLATDTLNNIFIGGGTSSTTNIASSGAYKTTLSGSADSFFAKFTPDGERLWGTYYGGNNSTEWASGSATDNMGSVYYSGITNSPSGIATPGAAQQTFGGGDHDGYLVKFTGDGQISWGTYYGGNSDEQNFSCATDRDSHVYFSGNTHSTNNISTPGSFQQTLTDFEDGFLACFNLSGQRKWGTYFGGSSIDWLSGCATNTNHEVYVNGYTSSPDNIGTSGTFQPNLAGGSNGFLAKFDTNCQRLWGTYYGSYTENQYGFAVDDSGYVFVVGNTSYSDNVLVTPGAWQSTMTGSQDCYLAKFDWNGQRIWGTYFGASDMVFSFSCAVDHNDNIFFSGITNSTSGVATPGSQQSAFGGGNYDVFLEKFADCYSPDSALVINGPDNLCSESNGIVYSISPLYLAASYSWSVSSGITIVSGGNSNSLTVNFSSVTGTDTITVFGINACGNGTPKSLVINVNPRPFPHINGPDTVCTGDTVIYITKNGMSNYLWTVSSAGTILLGGSTTDTTVTVRWNTGGAQWVSVNYTNLAGCPAISPVQKNIWVTEGPPVSITINANVSSVCTGNEVIYTALPMNEGFSPVYQWKVNGINVGTNSTSYSFTPDNGDIITCVLTSNIPCGSGNPATSNAITMIVNQELPVSVSISPSANPVCEGTAVTYTATPTNGGTNPSYQWKVNSVNVGGGGPNYSYIPANGDLVTCALTSNVLCPSGNPATSNTIAMIVNPNLPVSVSITASANPFCQGSSVTFTATPTNGGAAPSYQWKVNGINVGTNNPTYTYNPASGDLVSCILTSNIACSTGNPATSNSITMIVNANLPAGISITASTNPFCPGNSVTFTSATMYGGPTPSFQWKVNGVIVGTNSPTYTYNPASGDLVSCIMTSNLPCVTANPATSNTITMIGNLAPVVTFTRCIDSITISTGQPFRLQGGIPLGGIYSGPGVANGILYPNVAGVGTKTITYSYTNNALCTANASIQFVIRNQSFVICGLPLTDIRDGKSYQTVRIGSQCWMASNLNYGSMIPANSSQRENCIPEKYCPNDIPADCGLLTADYQWDELMQYDEVVSTQGLCPPGWHVPSEADWNTLFADFTNNGFAGSPLKYSGFSGFNALLYGARHLNEKWDYAGFATFYWSSTSHSSLKAWSHGMNDPDPSVSAYPAFRTNAFSVRCLKDN